MGTTVKVTGFFEHIPVRRQIAIKDSSKYLAKIRRLMQAYALARPAVRFRLHVLKAKNSKVDFIYAPSSKANIEDAALKVVGKDCALQCGWTSLELDGFDIQALLPKPTATGSKIANFGAFISIDGRPVSNMRGTVKSLVSAFKSRLRKMNPSLAGVKEPFIYVNITCPPGSYDPNIEPAKDDVMFENGDEVVCAFERLLQSYYPETAAVLEEYSIPTSAQQSPISQTPVQDNEDIESEFLDEPRWRSSMYGIDESDMQVTQDEQVPTIEEEEGIRAAEVSNPWTIARMNTAVKPRNHSVANQLPSPAKTQHDASPQRSPISVETPRRVLALVPRTPQSLAKGNTLNFLDGELVRSIRHVVPLSPTREMSRSDHSEELSPRQQEACRTPLQYTCNFAQANRSDYRGPGTDIIHSHETSSPSQITPHPKSSALRQTQRRQQPSYLNKPFTPPTTATNPKWFDQPMLGTASQQATRPKKHSKPPHAGPAANNSATPPTPHHRVPNPTNRILDTSLRPEQTNADIRAFFSTNTSDAPPQITTTTPSSTPPLKHTPPTSQTQYTVHTLETSIARIVQRARSLDMRRDCLGWGDQWTSVFAEPLSVGRVERWVAVMGELLGERFERVVGVDVDVGVLLCAGVKEGLRTWGEMDALVSDVAGTMDESGATFGDGFAEEMEDDMLLDL